MKPQSPLQNLLLRDQLIVGGGLGLISLLSWLYLLLMVRGTVGNSLIDSVMSLFMPRSVGWTFTGFVLVALMWIVMMTAMMVPTASTMILSYTSICRKREKNQEPYLATASFLSGYIVVWGGFGVFLALVQWGLHRAGMLSGMMGNTGSVLGGGLLMLAGFFQWSEWKYACLAKCRRPLGFLLTEWRQGAGGAFRMGLVHGRFCTVCCWALMCLMFVLGVMNVLWMVALTVFMLAEKMVPHGRLLSRLTGVFLLLWGVLLATGEGL